jgi:hypothetical protein
MLILIRNSIESIPVFDIIRINKAKHTKGKGEGRYDDIGDYGGWYGKQIWRAETD